MSAFTSKGTDYLPYEKIPFMHWGIISKFNFSSLDMVPRKRWDPLTFSPITLNEYGYSVVLEKNYGHYSYISPIRGRRPFHVEDTPEDESGEVRDVFSPVIEGKLSHDEEDPSRVVEDGRGIVVADDDRRVDDIFSVNPHLHKKLEGKAITLVNKYPPMVRCIDDELASYIQKSLDENSKLARGVNLVTIPTKFYRGLEPDIPLEDIFWLFKSMIASIKFSIEAAVSVNVRVIPVSSFFNIGREVGGSLERLHSQCYIDLSEDGHGSRMEAILKAFEQMKKSGSCKLCHSTHEDGKRVVYENDNWTFFTSGSPVRNHHLRFHPKRHVERFVDLNDEELMDLARGLRLVFNVMNEMGINPSRNILLNTKPFGHGESFFHMFGDILPYEFIGGMEMADDMRVARILPSKIAKEMRQIIKEKFSGEI
ncbi:MAG: HIT domain-containing protein [Promethearchaeota archaeon]